MFKNLKIGVKLGAGFAFVLLLLVAISAISLMRISDMTTATTVITDDRMPKMEMSNEIMMNTMKMARAIRNVVIATDKNFEKSQIDLIANTRKTNGEIMDKIKPMLSTEKGKAMFEKIVEARAKYGQAIDTIIPIAYSASPTYNPKQATEYLFGEYTKAANDYLEQVQNFSDFQKELAAKAS